MMKVLVFGGSRSGVAVSKLLIQKNYDVTITDYELMPEKKELESLGVKVIDGGHPEALMNLEWEFVVKNPGINYQNKFINFFKENDVKIYNEIEIALWYSDFKIGAITGTNGKTTTTSLLKELLELEYGIAYGVGNIGYPLSALVASGVTTGYIALEISAFQLIDTYSLKANCSTVINLTPDHLDFFDNLDDYYQAKLRVTLNQDNSDYFIYNCNDYQLSKQSSFLEGVNVDYLDFEKNRDIYLKNNQIYYQNVKLFEVKDLKLVGKHNLLNSMIAATMAYHMGVSPENIKKGISLFKGVEHRIEFVNSFSGVDYYNDSKATNVESTLVCLDGLKDRNVILLVGGYDKKLSFEDLKDSLIGLKRVIAYGETAEKIAELKEGTIVVSNIQEAVKIARELAIVGDCVVLSPACASYDQFKNFEHRGEVFKELVNSFK